VSDYYKKVCQNMRLEGHCRYAPSDTWTTEKPTEAGWYLAWYTRQQDKEAYPLRLTVRDGICVSMESGIPVAQLIFTHFKRIDLTPPEGADCWCDRIPEDHRPCDPCRHGATP